MVENNTSAMNGGSGFLVEDELFTGAGMGLISHDIGYGNRGYGLRSTGAIAPRLSCNDWFANDSGAVAGMTPSPDDLSVDPLFCNPDSSDVHLREGSPLADAPGCGLIGALGVGCTTTPTLVTLFMTERTPEGVRVLWRLADPYRFDAIWIERAGTEQWPWARLAVDPSLDEATVTTVDRTAARDHEFWYRLVAIHQGIDRVIAGSSRVEAEALRFALTAVAPNPASGAMRVCFTLARDAAVELEVFDIQGRRVETLVRATLPAGAHTLDWMGRAMPSGLYLLRYRYPGGNDVRRIVRSE